MRIQQLGRGLPFRRGLLGLGEPTRRFELVLPGRQMIFHVVGDLLTDRCQLKHLVLDGRIIGLLSQLQVHGRLVPEVVSPIHAHTPLSGASTAIKHKIGGRFCLY
jgi:hypothetical protein